MKLIIIYFFYITSSIGAVSECSKLYKDIDFLIEKKILLEKAIQSSAFFKSLLTNPIITNNSNSIWSKPASVIKNYQGPYLKTYSYDNQLFEIYFTIEIENINTLKIVIKSLTIKNFREKRLNFARLISPILMAGLEYAASNSEVKRLNIQGYALQNANLERTMNKRGGTTGYNYPKLLLLLFNPLATPEVINSLAISSNDNEAVRDLVWNSTTTKKNDIVVVLR